jgi:uncharacterized protein (TIGR03083 family)
MEHWDAIAAERTALAGDLEELSTAQWETPSLCGEWTVRQLVGHLVVTHTTSLPKFAIEMAKARGSFDRANSKLAVREGERPAADLVADLRRHANSHFKPPGFGSEAPLADILIHGRDIRIPLGLPEHRANEPWRHALDLLVSAKGARAFVPKGRPRVRLIATDLEWQHGDGDEVRGEAADLALALSGRTARVDALTGPGVDAVVAWLAA